MTKANIRESIQARAGLDWITRNKILPEVIDDLIYDEYEKLVGETQHLEGRYTGTTDGTNNYLEINESIMVVKGVWYDFTANSDKGTKLTEITPLDTSEDIDGGEPEYYWIQGMHRYNRQRLYFNKLPSSGITIMALFLKWPDSISSDTETLEIKRLWAKAIKEKVLANVLTMGRTERENRIKYQALKLALADHKDTMRVIHSIPKRPYVGTVSVYRDYGL